MSILLPPPGQWRSVIVLRATCRTELFSIPSTRLVRIEARRAAEEAGIELGDFLVVYPDGSGETWSEWPDARIRRFGPGTIK